jgi:hypothetical protein
MKTAFPISKLLILVLTLILYFVSPEAGYGSDPSESCPNDLLLLLRLDETSGPNYADYYGVHNAAASYSPAAVTGIVNGGQIFDENTKINIPDNGNEFDWAAGASFSLECWLKTSVKKGGVAIGRYRTDNPETNVSWWIGLDNDGYAKMEIKDNNNTNSILIASTNLADNQWHHVVAVRNGVTQHNKIYVDGVEVADLYISLPGDFTCPLPTDVTVGYLLRGNDWAPEYHFNGALDEIGIYTRALTAGEVASFYNEGSPTGHCSSTPPPDPGNIGNCPDNIMLLLKLDETSGPNYADYYGANNAIASTSPPAVSPTATTGIVNGGQIFNDNTYVNIPDNGSDFEWAAGCSFSLEFWIKTSVEGIAQVGISRQIAVSGITWWLGINEYGGAVMEIKDHLGNNYAVYNKNLAVNYYADNQWHHIVGVKDGATDYIKIYGDGVLVDEQHAIFSGNFIAPSPTDVSVGYMLRADGSSFEYHLIGALDEVAVYTRALSAAEILSFYNNGAPVGHCSSIYTPVIISTPDTTATEDVTYSYTFTVDDQDAGDILTLSAVSKPDWLNFNWTSGQKSAVLTGTPVHENVGTADVTLRVNDGYTNVDQSFSISVAGINHIPVITGQNALSINEDTPITLSKSDLIITDADNPPSDLTLQVLAGSNYTFDGNLVTPDANFNGPLSVNVIVKDLIGQSAVYPVIITVNSVNDVPIITSNPTLSIQANNLYIYLMTVEDADEDDVLTITAPSKPNWLTFTTGSNGATLMGVPTLSDVGSYAVILKINDGHIDVIQGFALQVSVPSGIDDIDNNMVRFVYPNPASDKIYFKFAKSEPAKIEIFDTTDKLQKEVSTENADLFEINISDISNGIYIYKTYQDGKIYVGKFIKN